MPIPSTPAPCHMPCPGPLPWAPPLFFEALLEQLQGFLVELHPEPTAGLADHPVPTGGERAAMVALGVVQLPEKVVITMVIPSKL